MALLGIERQIPSIMVTGSHIPDDRNGIKFNTPAGEILKEDEAGIRRQNVAAPEGLFDENGRFIDDTPLPDPDPAGRQLYLQRYLQLFPQDLLDGFRVGVYEHSSVARDLLTEVLENLGAEVVRLGRSRRFIPVDTEAIRPEETELAHRCVAAHRLDALLSTDGVRFTVDTGEIVHLRPSGNAPELRCYTEAGSAGRAAEINRECLGVMA